MAGPAEDAALSDVVDRLATLVRVLPVERDLFDLLGELPLLALPQDAQCAVLHRDLQFVAGERAYEHHKPRVLADVDEAAAAVEVELLVLVDHRVHVDAGAEIAATRRDSADKPRLHAEREQMQDAFLVGDRCHALRHPDAEVDDPVGGNSKAARRAMIFRSSIAPDTMLAR